MKQTRRYHSPICKYEAVALIVEHGYNCATAERNLDVSGALSGRCFDELGTQKTAAFLSNGKRSTEQQPIHELEVKTRRLRMERHIFKKIYGRRIPSSDFHKPRTLGNNSDLQSSARWDTRQR